MPVLEAAAADAEGCVCYDVDFLEAGREIPQLLANDVAPQFLKDILSMEITLPLIHFSDPTRLRRIWYASFGL